MAVKKTSKKADDATSTKAEVPAAAPKAKAAKPKVAKPAASEAKETPVAPAKAAAPKKKAAAPAEAADAPKKAAAAPIRLTPGQKDLLKRIGDAAEAGYTAEKKVEQNSIDNLVDKKLVKKGAKNKETGKVPYSLTKAGQKHIG